MTVRYARINLFHLSLPVKVAIGLAGQTVVVLSMAIHSSAPFQKLLL